ncbi:MAG: CRISPR-associated protein [Rhodothermales bacterium]
MLLNLSNHPSSGWGADQRGAAAAQFGSVEDLVFPNIDPEWDAAQVAALADDYVVRCIEVLRPHERPSGAVHVMGEMTFTCALVARLHARGIPCVASTTERIVKKMPNGDRRITFRFVRFRAYPRIQTLDLP